MSIYNKDLREVLLKKDMSIYSLWRLLNELKKICLYNLTEDDEALLKALEKHIVVKNEIQRVSDV